jgi:hypothetical protein
MSLILGQLIYTSFPKGELKVLTSEGVSPDIRDAFIERVTEHWAAKGPSRPGYHCVYLHQITREKTLFGWLYNDDIDEVGRSHCPYFIGYYLTGRLNPAKLKNIFALLEQGPPNDVDRQNPPEHLEPVVAPDLWNYQPARTGVAIPAQVYERSLRVLEKGQLIDFFVPHGEASASQVEANLLFPGQPLEPLAEGATSSLQNNSLEDLPWKPLLGVAAVCVAAITLSLSFIFSPSSTSDFPKGKDTAYAIDRDAQIAALASDPRARLSPEPITGQSLEAAKQIVAQIEQPLTEPFMNQSTQKLAQSVEARAKERLEETPASVGTNAPKLSKKLVAALEKEPPPLSAQAKARLKAKSKLKSAKLMAKRPSSQSTRSKPASGDPSIVVIDSSRELPLKRTEPATARSAPVAPAKTYGITSSVDCYGAQAKRSYQCRNRKN